MTENSAPFSYELDLDLTAEQDAPTVNWVDERLDEAEREGHLTQLLTNLHPDAYSTLESTQLANLFEESLSADENEDDPAPQEPMTREEIRELIFSRLRRPDGAPDAAGYTVGPVARKAVYEGEDTQKGWRDPTNKVPGAADSFTTEYQDRSTLDSRAARADEGLVLGSDGQPVDGRWGWVIDQETGYLLLFDAARAEVTSPEGITGPPGPAANLWSLVRAGYKVSATHHTTPVAGMPVTGAGMMTLSNGSITELTDESGHYRPDAVQQFAALQALLAQGFDLSAAMVRLTGDDMGGRPTGKAEWLEEAADDNARFPTDDVTLRPEQFVQTGGDEYQIRSKMALNEEITGRGKTPATTSGYGTVQQQPNAYSFSDDASGSGSYDDEQSVDGGYVYSEPNLGADGGYTEPDQDSPAADPDAAFVERGRAYLASAGRSGFAEWFRSLARQHQDLLLTDDAIAAAWRAENPPAPAWLPGDADQATAAAANASIVDALADRRSTTFTVAGFLLLIGDGHDPRYRTYTKAAADAVTGTVVVRKSGLGRGAGSLTFNGVPPAKQAIVIEAVTRFSCKTVTFA